MGCYPNNFSLSKTEHGDGVVMLLGVDDCHEPCRTEMVLEQRKSVREGGRQQGRLIRWVIKGQSFSPGVLPALAANDVFLRD